MMNIDKYIGKTKGVLTIIGFDKEELNKVNKKHIFTNCKCSICGKVSKVRLDRITTRTPYAEHYCKYCKKNYLIKLKENELLNKTFGVLTVVSFNKWENGYQWYNCKCNRCGNMVIVRADRIKSKTYIPQSCTNCYYDLLGEKTRYRYESKYKLKGKEYEIAKKINSQLLKFKAGAKVRNISFELTDEEAKDTMKKPCYYCGELISFGIDRVDSAKGYQKDNIVPCCGVCNIMKNSFSKETFLDRISKIYNIHCKESSTTIETTSLDGKE